MRLCESPAIDLQLGDCLDLMPLIPDKSIDMILADLPYGTTACHWDTVIPFELLWKQYKRIIKDNGAIVLTASQPFTSALVMSNIDWFKYEWIWDKGRPTGVLNAKYMPMKKHENVLVFYSNKPKYNPILSDKKKQDIRDNGRTYKHTNNGAYGETMSAMVLNEFRTIPVNKKYPDSVLKIQRVGTFGFEKTGHPTQKPVKLFEYLIRTYTNEGETVLDNVAGSGTTAIACYNINRNAILMEKDEKYFEIAKKRIENHVKQLHLWILL